jgi:small redox-active disulfide protein 2
VACREEKWIPPRRARCAALVIAVQSADTGRRKQMEIKVLGPGCAKCKQTEKIVKEAVAAAGVEASVEKVTDVMAIAGYGVFGTPAVVVDGVVKSVGKIPKKDEIIEWLTK